MGSIVMEPGDIEAYASIYQLLNNTATVCMSVGKIQSRGIFYGLNPLHYSVPLLLVQFSLASLIILLTSRLLRPLGQTSMVSQILGGIILGPSILGRIGGFTETLFPLRGFIILDTLAIFGYMFYFFLIGVQMDPWILKKIEKKDLTIGISTVAVAMLLSITWSFVVMGGKIVSIEQKIASSLPVVATSESVLCFPTIAHFLTELKMTNSEFGRVALISAVVSNLFSFCVITLTVLWNQQPTDKFAMLRSLSGGIAMAVIILVVVRPTVLWMMHRTPEGESLKEEFIYIIFVGVLMAGFCSQASGLNIFLGPLLFGLAIPAGPPVGSALVDRLDIFTSWMFMPLYFVKNGLVMNMFSVKLKNYLVVQFIILVANTGKFLGALLSALYCSIPPRDAFSLGLLMNVQGVLELGMFKMMKQAKAIDNEAFVIMCTWMLIVTAVITPILRYLYDPSKRYIVYEQRTVMHSKPNSELRVVACIHDRENVPTFINLLEAINPTKRSPIAIYVLHLIELIGRVHPILTPHKLTKSPSTKASTSKSIIKAFKYFEQSYHDGVVSVQPFTAICPYATVHDEVCTMALDKRVSLIIVPFQKRFTANGDLESFKKGIKVMNDNIIDKAPCSVAVIVDRGLLNTSRPILQTWSSYRVAVLFLGGADDREALALGSRMAGNQNINLTIVRLLENGNITSDNTSERKLDNEMVSEFRLSMAGNYQVTYIEEVVMDGTGTVAVIRSMENSYELIVVGRHHERRSPLLYGLTGWNEETELGAMGDLLASQDFQSNASILVVQQHTNVVNEWNAKKKDKFNLHVSHDIEDEAEDIPIQRNAA